MVGDEVRLGVGGDMLANDVDSDYNYERLGDGTCQLVAGLQPADHAAVCKEDPNRIEYFEPTGYRRIPLTTCQGGNEFDKLKSLPCPGHEADYDQKHGISGVGLFFAIVVPFAAAGAIGYYAWTHWRHKLSGFGQIRLGESMGNSSLADRNSPLITVPVAVIAGAWAVSKATPLLAMSFWRSLKGYMPVGGGRGGGWMGRTSGPYTSRGAFSARRPDYSHVVADEDELLGDDLDDGEDV